MKELYRVKESFPVVQTWYKDIYGSGTIKEGEIFSLEKEPDYKKKLYRLQRVGKFPCKLQVRPSHFKKYFEKVEEDNG